MHEIAVAALLSVRIGILRELERESEKAPPKVVNFDNALQIILVIENMRILVFFVSLIP